jgi:hypothetical protein
VQLCRCLCVAAATLLATGFCFASDLGALLDHQLKGGWGVLGVEVWSACGGTYSDNLVGAMGVSSKAPHRFAVGELVRVDDVKLKRRRVDLLLTTAAPLRVSWMEGPFELFEQRPCRVQLMVPVPRELIKQADLEAILTEVRRHARLFSTLEDAKDSAEWNGRLTEPFPENYEETLRLHAIWQAEQTNAAVQHALDHALTEAADAVDDMDDDHEYLAGFSAGAERMSKFTVATCSTLLNASFSSYRDRAPGDRSQNWEDGWKDGQRMVFHILLADRLRACFVPLPEVSPTPP